MKLVDANVLLYAVKVDSQHHERSLAWLDASLSGGDTGAFAWMALLAFLRLATKREVFPVPLSIDGAMDRVDAWLQAPAAVVVAPTVAHGGVVRRLLLATAVGGNLVNDAHLAALAIEHRCGIISFDRDFERFPGVEWSQPSV